MEVMVYAQKERSLYNVDKERLDMLSLRAKYDIPRLTLLHPSFGGVMMDEKEFEELCARIRTNSNNMKCGGEYSIDFDETRRVVFVDQCGELLPNSSPMTRSNEPGEFLCRDGTKVFDLSFHGTN